MGPWRIWAVVLTTGLRGRRCAFGLRYDYYATISVEQTSDIPVELYNLEKPSDLRLLDFGPPRPADSPYDADGVNFGPRFGFAYTLNESGSTVIRGGVGVLFSPHLRATLQNQITNPFVPQNVLWNEVDVQANGNNLGWDFHYT